METDRIATAQAVHETKPDASDRKPGEAPKRDAITRTTAPRSPTQRAILGAGILALMALSAGAYVYSVWDASRDIANRLKSEPPASSPSTAPRVAESPVGLSSPAATPAPPTATAAPAATPTPAAPPAIAAAPKSQAPASTQAPINNAPVTAAEPAPPASLQQQPASLPKEDVVFVQKPGVRMRSEPGRHGKVVGGPPKGSQFKIVGRAGSWVQVEGDAGRGWIGGRMLGPQSP